jgi:hypothetical protein
MSFGDINNNTVYDIKRKLNFFITSGGSSDTFINSKNNVCLKEDCPGHQPGQAHHQRPQQVHEVPGTGDKHWRTTIRKMVSEDGPDSLKLPLHLPAEQCSCPQQQEERRTGSRRALTEVFEKDIWPPSSTDFYSFV